MKLTINFQISGGTQTFEGLQVLDFLRQQVNITNLQLADIPQSLYVKTYTQRVLTEEEARASQRFNDHNGIMVWIKFVDGHIPMNLVKPEDGIQLKDGKLDCGCLIIDTDYFFTKWVRQGYPDQIIYPAPEEAEDDEEYVEP